MLQKLSNNKILLILITLLILAGLLVSAYGVIRSFSEQAGQSGPAPAELMPREEKAPADGKMPPDGGMAHSAPGSAAFYVPGIAMLVLYILLAIYFFAEYRTPHGNLLRFTMFAFAMLLTVWSLAQSETRGIIPYVLPCTAIIIAYLSGRLNKIKKNIWWCLLVAALLLFYSIYHYLTPAADRGVIGFHYNFGLLLQWLVLMFSYFGRYEQHRHAGENA